MNTWTTPQVIKFGRPRAVQSSSGSYIEDGPERATGNICSIIQCTADPRHPVHSASLGTSGRWFLAVRRMTSILREDQANNFWHEHIGEQ